MTFLYFIWHNENRTLREVNIMLKRNKANYFLFLFIDNSYPASSITPFNVHKFGSTITKNDSGSTITNEGIIRLTLLGSDVNLGGNAIITEKSGIRSVYFFVNFNNALTIANGNNFKTAARRCWL